MDTSTTIKQAQYQPHPVRKVGNGVYRTSSRDGSHEHTVTRRGEHFHCDCSASGLCHHVTDVVMDSARRHGWKVVQVWTSEADARRQKRRHVTYQAGNRDFWVTFAGGTKAEPKFVGVPAPEPPRDVLVRFLWDRLTPPTEEEWTLVPMRDVEVDDGSGWRPARMPFADICGLAGWGRGEVQFRRANAKAGGLHLFEFQMRKG